MRLKLRRQSYVLKFWTYFKKRPYSCFSICRKKFAKAQKRPKSVNFQVLNVGGE